MRTVYIGALNKVMRNKTTSNGLQVHVYKTLIRSTIVTYGMEVSTMGMTVSWERRVGRSGCPALYLKRERRKVPRNAILQKIL